MVRKSTAKPGVERLSSSTETSKFDFISLSDISDCLILKIKEEDSDVVSHRANSTSDQEWRKILKIFYDALDNKEIEQLRFFGITHRKFSLVKMRNNDRRISSIVFDRSTDLNVLFDLLPHSAGLKHVTFRGCTKYPNEKRHYAIRVHYSDVNSFETVDFVNIRDSLFSNDPNNLNDPKFFPKKLLLRPYRFDTEIFVRYYFTPKSLAEMISGISSQGGFCYQGEWMVYKMIQNKQLLCKCGINGVYCVVTPAGCNTTFQTPLERFVWCDKNYDVDELLLEPEEINDRRATRHEWNSLTNDLKLKCIGSMNFKTRINLGSTCHAEKSLLDSAEPYSFKFVKVEHLTYSDNSQTMSVVAQNSKEILHIRSERWVEHKNDDQDLAFEKTASAVKHILKFCEIGALFLYPGAREEGMEYLQKELANSCPFKFSTFYSDVLNPRIQLFLIGNCISVMDTVYLRVTKSFAPTKYFEIPQILKSKCLQIKLDKPGSEAYNGPYMLVSKWIRANAEIGKKAVFALFNRLFNTELEIFSSRLGDRVISKTDEMVLIRLDDESKRILAHIYYDHDDHTYFTCRVISSELKESEYELDERPWIDESEFTYNFAEIDEEDENEDVPSFE